MSLLWIIEDAGGERPSSSDDRRVPAGPDHTDGAVRDREPSQQVRRSQQQQLSEHLEV